MRTAFILTLLLTCIQTRAQTIDKWYRVISSNNKMWNAGHNIHIIGIGGDSVLISGFSNQGASVTGRVTENEIIIPKQIRTIIPFGGDGKIKWDIVVQAEGTITDSVLALNFYFEQDTFKTRGIITALPD